MKDVLSGIALLGNACRFASTIDVRDDVCRLSGALRLRGNNFIKAFLMASYAHDSCSGGHQSRMGVARRAAVLVCCVVLFGVAPASAQNFFDSYLKPEYLVPVTEFPSNSGGDLYGSYYQVPIPSLVNGELLIVGE